jgi:hypothetical protein
VQAGAPACNAAKPARTAAGRDELQPTPTDGMPGDGSQVTRPTAALRLVATRSRRRSALPTVRSIDHATRHSGSTAMYATTDLRAKSAAFVLALLTSVTVIGATVTAMQPADAGLPVIALQPVVVTAVKAL